MRNKSKIIIFTLVLLISIGFALVSNNLNIFSNLFLRPSTVTVKFGYCSTVDGSAEGYCNTNDTSVNFGASLVPGEFYGAEISVDIDSPVSLMINSISINGVEEVKDYVDFTFRNSYGERVREKQFLYKDSAERYYVEVAFKDGLELDDSIDISFSIDVEYVPEDGTYVNPTGFLDTQLSSDSWDTIVSNIRNGNTDMYNLGDQKTITLNEYGDATVRLVNKSTDPKCGEDNFSETACGFVFEMIQTPFVINAYSDLENHWSESLLRDRVNSYIDSFPDDLKDYIIDTKVITGNSEPANVYRSTDKLYIGSATEYNVDRYNYELFKSLTRPFDFYNYHDATVYSRVILNYNYDDLVDDFYEGSLPIVFRYANGNNYLTSSGSFAEYQYDNTYYGVSPMFRVA